ncbi:protein PFC0760c [Spodoptera frugiperda]|uniref:Protein PFC0760c n=1 Tax=Spodoptera frugiperda TaxID=7108 RepID=A0A9R0DRL8_SPOFR|nr:protein PFC0760c [Spodoptera frugiperda]
MRLLSILVCVALVSIAHAKLYHKYPKPKLNYIQLYNSHNYKYKPLLPEERRRLALFPKNPMRYMVSLEPTDNDPKPYLEKKKPLMKKFEQMITDNEIKRTKQEDILEEADIVQKPIVEVDVIKEVSIEIVEDKPDESESQHTASEPSVVIESEAPKDNNDKEIIVQLEEIILPPKTELATMIENDNGGELPNGEETDKYSSENEVVGVTEKDNVSNEDSEIQKHVNVTQGKLSDTIESIDNSDKEIIVQLQDIILPPKSELEASIETKNDEVLSNGEETNKYSSENEVVDVTEKDSVSKEDSEFQKHVNEMQDELSDIIESVVSLDNSDKEIIIQVEDIILPPKTELEASVETKDDEEKENVSQEPGELSDITKSEDVLDKEIIIQLEDIILPPNIEVEAILENKSGEMLSDAEDTNRVDDATEKSNQESEFQKLVNEKQDGPSDIIESGIPIDNSDKEIIIQVEDIILPPKTELEASIEPQNEVLLNGKETDKYSSENEVGDITEKENISNEDSEFQKHDNEMQDVLSDIIESVVSSNNIDKEIIIEVEDIILPPKTELEANLETKNDEVLPNGEKTQNVSNEERDFQNDVSTEQGELSDTIKSEDAIDKEIIVQLEDIILPLELEAMVENKSDEVLLDAEDNKESEFEKHVNEMQDVLSDIIESVVSLDNSDKEIIIQVEDIILPPKTELEASIETKNDEVLPNEEITNKDSSENKEDYVIDKDNISNVESEFQNDAREEQGELRDVIESGAPLDKSDKELIAQLEDIVLLPKTELNASVENKTGEVLPDVKETKESESNDDPREKQDELNNVIESELPIDNNDNEKAVQLADIILPPNNKLEAMMAENKNDEVLPDVKETIESGSHVDPREKQDELNNIVESEVPIDNNDNEKAVQLADIILPPNNKLEAMMAENKNDEVLPDAKETIESESNDDPREKQDELNNIVESEVPIDNNDNEKAVQLADIVLPLKIELDGSAENINSEVLQDIEETNKYSSENEVGDVTEKDNVRNEEKEFNQNELNNIVESEAPLDNSNYEKVVQLADIILPPKTEIEVSEEDKRGEVLPDVEEINKSLNVNDVGNVSEKANVGNEESEFQNGELNDIIESEAPRDNNNKEIIVQLADIILPPKSEFDSSADNKNGKVLPAVEEAHKSLNESEVDEENKREEVLPNVEETKESEFQNDARGSLDELNNIVESEAPLNNNNDENTVQLADIVLPPNTELDGNAENKNDEVLLDLEERNENLSKNQVDDETEKDTVNKESESQNESRKNQDELNNIINSEVPLDNSNNENTIQLADTFLPLKIELERGVESTSSEVLPVNENFEETNKSLNENEVSDVTEKANVSNEENEFQNDASKEQSELSDVIKSEAPRDNNDKEMTVQLADIILPPKSEFDSSAENKNAKDLLDVEEPNESLNESEVDDKNKMGEVLPDAEETKESEFQNDAREDVLSNMIESEAPLDNSNYENTIQLADIVLPLKIELEGGVESTSSEVLPVDVEETNKYSSESEVNEGDLTEKDNVRNEESGFQNDARGSQDELNDIIESEAPLNNSNYENTVQLADIILPPKTELEVSEENINVEVLPNETNKSEVDDAAEKENVSKEESAQKIDDSDRENTVQLSDNILPPKRELEGGVESISNEVLPVNEDVKETNKSFNVNELGDVTEKVNVNNEESEFQNDVGKEQSELSDMIESESPRDNNDKEMTVQLADIILPPKTELEGNLESTSGEVLPHVEETYKSEVDDAVEKDNVSNEETIQKVDDSEKENTIQLVDIILPPKTELENGVENTSGEVLPNVEETNKSEVNDAAEKDHVSNEEVFQKIDNSDKENTVQLADLILPPKSELKVSEENISGEVLPDVEETNKSEVNDAAEKVNVNNEESIQKIDNSDKENTVQLADIILPPKTEFDASVEKENGEALPDIEETNKSSSENEGDDITNKAIEKDDVINKESIKKIDDSDKENTVRLADLIFPPKSELKVSEENKSVEVLPDVEETNKSEVNDAAEMVNVNNEESIQKIDNSEKENTLQLADIILPPKTELKNGVENTSGEVLPNVEETNKSEVDDTAEKDKVNNEETIQKIDNSDNENTVQLVDIILPPKTELENGVESTSGEVLPHVEETNKSEVNDAAEKDNVSNEESIQKIDNSDKENTVQLTDIILPPKRELEGSVESTSGEVLPVNEDIKETNKSFNENKVDDVTEKANVSNEESEFQNDASKEQGDIKDTVQLADIILPPKTEFDASAENKNGEALPDIEKTNKSSSENEGDDVIEKAIGEENVSNEEPEEFVTTETYMEPVIYRKKRGINIIEEENVSPTVAGFKYNVKDRRLNNHLAYNNINS